MADEQQQVQKRQVAVKVSINDIMSATYVEKEGWEPNIIETQTGIIAGRVNVVGIVVEINEPVEPTMFSQLRCIIEDGTGLIEARSFDTFTVASEITVGSPVLIIGRPRQYNNTIFLVPEIIRTLEDKAWVELRKKELAVLYKDTVVIEQKKDAAAPMPTQVTEEEDALLTEEIQEHDLDKNALQYIEDNDSGSGVAIENIVAFLDEHDKNTDNKAKITNLLLNGEIFEIKPGFVKVLK